MQMFEVFWDLQQKENDRKIIIVTSLELRNLSLVRNIYFYFV